MMRRWKWILISFGGIVAICIVIAAIFIATLDDDDYKRFIIKTVERRTGYKVKIRGDFSLDLSTQPSLLASDIVFQQRSGGPKPPIQHIGLLKIQLSARPLVSGTILVKYLEVSDVTIAWVLGEDSGPPAQSTSIADKKFPTIPVFEDVDLRNIRASITSLDGNRIEEIILERLDIDKVAQSGRLRIEAQGSVNDNTFILEGQLGSLAEALDDTHPYPLELNFSVADFSLDISGTVDELIHGKGLNMRVTAKEQELATLASILKGNSPQLGALNLHAVVTGDITAPSISELVMRLGDKAAPRFTAQGTIGNVLTGDGTDIRVTASIKSKTIIGWLLAQELFDFNAFRLEGRLRETGGELFLEDAIMEASDEHGLSLRGEGTFNLGDPFEVPWVDEIDATLSFSSPTIQFFKPLLGMESMPDLGSVAGKAHITGSSDQLTLRDVDVTAKKAETLSVGLRGRIGPIIFDDPEPVSEIDMGVSVRSESTSQLSAFVDLPIPDLGAFSADARFYGHDGSYALDSIEILIGSEERLQIKATGVIDRMSSGAQTPVNGININISFSSPDTQSIAALIERELPEIGAINGRFLLSGSNKTLAIKDAEFSAGSAEELQITGTGEIASVKTQGDDLLGGVDFELIAVTPKSAIIGELFDFDMPEMGQLNLTAHLKNRGDKYDISEFVLEGGPAENPILHARGSIQDILSSELVSLDATFNGQSKLLIELIGAHPIEPLIELVGAHPTESIPFSGIAQISGIAPEVQIRKFELSTKGEDRLAVSAVGTARTSGEEYNLDLKIAAEAAGIAAINAISGMSLPVPGPIAIDAKLSGNTKEPVFDGKIFLGKTEFTVDAKSSFAGGRLKIDAKVSSPAVHVDDLGIFSGEPETGSAESEKKAPVKSEYLFSDTPIPFDRLKLLDLNLDLKADQLRSESHVLNDLSVMLSLSGGVLQITSARLNYTEGAVSTELTIDASGSEAEVRIRSTAEDVDAGDMLRRLHKPLLMDGRVTIFADLQSVGNSPRELASALNGEFALAIEDGKIRRIANLLAMDAVDLLVTVPSMVVPESVVPGPRGYTGLNCMALRFLFEDGKGVSEVIFLDTRELRIAGAGSIDLTSEMVDFVIVPKSKKKRFSVTSSVRISGSLRQPSQRKIPAKEAAQLAGEILAPYIFLPARGLGYLWYLIRTDKDQRAPCRDLAPPVE